MTDELKSDWRSAVPLRIGAFTAHPTTNELAGEGGRQRLRPILMDVLLRLAADAGKVVSRDSLIADVWSRRMVNDEVLSRAIAELRTALQDEPREPRYIETLPKIGYRLIARVEPAAEETHADRRELAAQTQPVSGEAPAVERRGRSGWHPRARWAVALMLVAAAGLAALWRLWPSPSTSPDARPDSIALERQLAAAIPLTADPELEFHARVAPDGRHVVFVKRDEAGSQLVIQDLRDGTRQVSAGAARGDATLASPVFFPDGRRLAYYRRAADGSDCGIYAGTLAGADEVRLVGCEQAPRALFDLSPDGRTLAYAALRQPQMPSGIHLLDLATQQATVVTSPEPGEGADIAPRFSPDGRRLAFFRGSQSHSSVWLANVAAPHTPQRASRLDGLVYGMAWLAADGPLVVSADWAGFRALNLLDLSSGASQLLGARGARYPDVARDGTIVYENATYRADLWLTSAEAPGQDARAPWPSTRYTNQAEFSPDGKQVLFASNRDGLERIYIGAADGTLRRLPFPVGYRHIRPHWSRDGRAVYATRIALDGPLPTNQQAVRLELENGRLTVLEKLGNSVNDVQELAGGELMLSELVGHAARLTRIAADGSASRLPLPLVNQYAVLGNTLVFTQPQLAGATQCRLDKLECAPLAIALDDGNRFDWTLARDAIWYLSRADGKLVRFDLASQALKRFDYAPSAAGTNIAVSPDGRRLLLAREVPPLIDLMIAPRVQAP